MNDKKATNTNTNQDPNNNNCKREETRSISNAKGNKILSERQEEIEGGDLNNCLSSDDLDSFLDIFNVEFLESNALLLPSRLRNKKATRRRKTTTTETETKMNYNTLEII